MSPHAGFLQRTPLAEARRLLTAGLRPVAAERIDVSDAAGRFAAEDLFAKHAAPHYRASAMDGVAVRAADTLGASTSAPILLRAVAATDPPPAAGIACGVAVDTGSLLPEWTDAVVRIEDCVADGDGWRIHDAVAAGRDLRPAGEDFVQGELLVAAGSRLRAWDLGALLSTGTGGIAVRRRPRVAIVATGSEVVEPDAAAGPGQVIESNSRMIAALVEQWGGSAHRLGIVTDDERRLLQAIGDAANRFDAVCVLAGSSAGRRDFTIPVLRALGEVFVHGVDIAPGRPVALARLRRSAGEETETPVIAVPGYPVSAIVVCEQLLAPLVAALLGTAPAVAPTLRARLARKLPSRIGMEEFRRVCLVRQDDGSLVAAPLAASAGSLSTVSGAQGWLRIDEGAEGVDAGAEVEIELLVSAAEVDTAFVVAGLPSQATARLARRLRTLDAAARVATLRILGAEALRAVERGEAHAAVVGAGDTVPGGFVTWEGEDLWLALRPGSRAEQRLARAGLRRREP